ncbi:hypothetical protein [Sorangium sp. So ce128]|uniref:hypothetical protein n=1 Tax=Sorangium sp. So ce128 TaxID=3133281 RepID=UPI003F627980
MIRRAASVCGLQGTGGRWAGSAPARRDDLARLIERLDAGGQVRLASSPGRDRYPVPER